MPTNPWLPSSLKKAHPRRWIVCTTLRYKTFAEIMPTANFLMSNYSGSYQKSRRKRYYRMSRRPRQPRQIEGYPESKVLSKALSSSWNGSGTLQTPWFSQVSRGKLVHGHANTAQQIQQYLRSFGEA